MRAELNEAQFPFLARLSRAGRDELGALAITRTRPGQRLLRRGAPANGAYLVSAGKLRVYYISEEGREATLYNVEPGGTCVLALSATFSDEPYPAWVDAGSSGCGFTRVPSPVFQRLLEREPAFRQYVLGRCPGACSS
jgi:CRP-like cAMP-binding protein